MNVLIGYCLKWVVMKVTLVWKYICTRAEETERGAYVCGPFVCRCVCKRPAVQEADRKKIHTHVSVLISENMGYYFVWEPPLWWQGETFIKEQNLRRSVSSGTTRWNVQKTTQWVMLPVWNNRVQATKGPSQRKVSTKWSRPIAAPWLGFTINTDKIIFAPRFSRTEDYLTVFLFTCFTLLLL